MQLIILVLTHRWINKLEKHQGMDKEDNTPIPENTWWVCVTPGILRELVELCTWIQISRIHHTRWLTSHNRPYKNEVTTQDKEGNRQNFDHVQIKVLSYPTCKRRVFLFLSTRPQSIEKYMLQLDDLGCYLFSIEHKQFNKTLDIGCYIFSNAQTDINLLASCAECKILTANWIRLLCGTGQQIKSVLRHKVQETAEHLCLHVPFGRQV
jgi:hypothetical protein